MLVVGGGQSALESAALLHESGANVEVFVRARVVHWLHGGKYHRMLGRWSSLVYSPADVGPMGLSRIVTVPDLFRRIPRVVGDPMAARSIRPAGAAWLVPRLADIPIRTGTSIRSIAPDGPGVRIEANGSASRQVDHVMFGTGYRINLARLECLPGELVSQIHLRGGYPVLGPGMETTVPGLHVVGAPAALSFGPVMRFVSGSWYTARAVTGVVTDAARAGRRPDRSPKRVRT